MAGYGPLHLTLERLGLSPLARLRRRAWGDEGADVRPLRLRPARRLSRAQITNSPERWYFCQLHAGEYNRRWDYFEGLSAEEAAAREATDRRTSAGFAEASHYCWGGPGDGTRSRDEMRALDLLEVEADADFDAIKAAWRRLAKANHPDARPGDAEAAERFRVVQAAFEVLREAEERRAAA